MSKMTVGRKKQNDTSIGKYVTGCQNTVISLQQIFFWIPTVTATERYTIDYGPCMMKPQLAQDFRPEVAKPE